MKFLFYIEPTIQLGNPQLGENWAQAWVSQLMTPLAKAANGPTEFSIVISEELRGAVPAELEITKFVFAQAETFEFGQFDSAQLARKILLDPHCEEAKRKAACISDKMAGLEPDLIIAFSPCAFLVHAFPTSVIVNHEYSAFSRHLYPENWFFDKGGYFQNSFLDKHIQAYKPSDEARRAACEIATTLREKLNDLLVANNYCGLSLEENRKRFLLPLQFSNYVLFDSFTAILQQFKLAEYVAASKPDDVTLIITEHPALGEISTRGREYLQNKYENVYFITNSYPFSTSELLSPIIDGYIGVTSKTNFLSTLWNKPFINLCSGSVFDALSCSKDISSDWTKLTPLDPETRESILAYTLVEGTYFEDDLKDEAWCRDLLARLQEKWPSTTPLIPKRDKQQVEKIVANWQSAVTRKASDFIDGGLISEFIALTNDNQGNACLERLDRELILNGDLNNDYCRIEHTYHLAIALLNFKGDFSMSAEFFDKCFKLCLDYSGEDHFDRVRDLCWYSVFHRIYALYLLGDRVAAGAVHSNALSLHHPRFGVYDKVLFSRLTSYCPELDLSDVATESDGQEI